MCTWRWQSWSIKGIGKKSEPNNSNSDLGISSSRESFLVILRTDIMEDKLATLSKLVRSWGSDSFITIAKVSGKISRHYCP